MVGKAPIAAKRAGHFTIAALVLCLLLCIGVQMADFATTIRVITLPGGVEMMPLARLILAHLGTLGLFAFKLTVALVFASGAAGGLALLAYDRDRWVRFFARALVAAAVGCNLVGVVVVIHNVQVIALLLAHAQSGNK